MAPSFQDTPGSRKVQGQQASQLGTSNAPIDLEELVQEHTRLPTLSKNALFPAAPAFCDDLRSGGDSDRFDNQLGTLQAPIDLEVLVQEQASPVSALPKHLFSLAPAFCDDPRSRKGLDQGSAQLGTFDAPIDLDKPYFINLEELALQTARTLPTLPIELLDMIIKLRLNEDLEDHYQHNISRKKCYKAHKPSCLAGVYHLACTNK